MSIPKKTLSLFFHFVHVRLKSLLPSRTSETAPERLLLAHKDSTLIQPTYQHDPLLRIPRHARAGPVPLVPDKQLPPRKLPILPNDQLAHPARRRRIVRLDAALQPAPLLLAQHHLDRPLALRIRQLLLLARVLAQPPVDALVLAVLRDGRGRRARAQPHALGPHRDRRRQRAGPRVARGEQAAAGVDEDVVEHGGRAHLGLELGGDGAALGRGREAVQPDAAGAGGRDGEGGRVEQGDAVGEGDAVGDGAHAHVRGSEGDLARLGVGGRERGREGDLHDVAAGQRGVRLELLRDEAVAHAEEVVVGREEARRVERVQAVGRPQAVVLDGDAVRGHRAPEAVPRRVVEELDGGAGRGVVDDE